MNRFVSFHYNERPFFTRKFHDNWLAMTIKSAAMENPMFHGLHAGRLHWPLLCGLNEGNEMSPENDRVALCKNSKEEQSFNGLMVWLQTEFWLPEKEIFEGR